VDSQSEQRILPSFFFLSLSLLSSSSSSSSSSSFGSVRLSRRCSSPLSVEKKQRKKGQAKATTS
jgi:hypothetical protein